MRRAVLLGLTLALGLAGCGQSMPETRHYRLVVPAPTAPLERVTAPCVDAGPQALLVEDFDVDAAYDDVAIVYRESPYRVERYHYHQWIAPPGRLVSDALGDGFAATGLFARVDRAWTGNANAILRGRVIALEEVDRTSTQWVGHVEVELELVDADTERSLWKRRLASSRVLAERDPEALAAAVSDALGDIVRESARPIATTLAAAACADEEAAGSSPIAHGVRGGSP